MGLVVGFCGDAPEWQFAAGLCLAEDHDGFGPDAVMLHRIGRRVGLHEFLKRGHVRDLSDQAHTIRALGVMERTNRDAQGPE
jgi:hypothetical protein